MATQPRVYAPRFFQRHKRSGFRPTLPWSRQSMLRSAIIAIELSSTPLQELPRCSLLASAQPDSLRKPKEAISRAPLRRSSPTPFNLSHKMRLRFRYACLLGTMELQGSTALELIGRLIAILMVAAHSGTQMFRWHKPVIRCCLNIGEQETSPTIFLWRRVPTSYTCTSWLRRRMILRPVSLM